MNECPECGFTETWKIGYRLVRSPFPHRKQRLQCKRCGRTFYMKSEEKDEIAPALSAEQAHVKEIQ